MSQEMLLENGVVVCGGSNPKVIEDGVVAWKDDRITFVGTRAEARDKVKKAKTIDAYGGMIMPGFINMHHHFYSALARGLNPGKETRNFSEVLDRLWWRLDRALFKEAVRISAQLTIADCIRSGCTTIFDHHASPSFIEGSLELLAQEILRAGLGGVLCYEVTDRNGQKEAMAGIDENLAFMKKYSQHERMRGVMGLHASFTLRDQTLLAAARKQQDLGLPVGCHIHVAEDLADISESQKAFGMTPVERLEKVGLLGEKTLMAHCVHLTPESLMTAAQHGSIVIHNPESNANNGVGRLDVEKTVATGCLVVLGTDGMSSNMLRSLRFAFLGHRSALRDPSKGFTVLPDLLLKNNAAAARRFFDEPRMGELAVGAPADMAVVDCVPPTVINDGNLFGHMIYGASEYPVRHTIARGKVVFDNFKFTTLDPQQIATEARRVSPDLWKRFGQLMDGTPFIGN